MILKPQSRSPQESKSMRKNDKYGTQIVVRISPILKEELILALGNRTISSWMRSMIDRKLKEFNHEDQH